MYIGVNDLPGQLHAAPPAPDTASSLVPLAALAVALFLLAVIVVTIIASRR